MNDPTTAVTIAFRIPGRWAHPRELVERLPGAALHHWYEDLGVRPATDVTRPGRIDLGSVEVRPDAQVYLCGPLPFMEQVRSSLRDRGVPEAHIHYEVFGPDTWLSAA